MKTRILSGLVILIVMVSVLVLGGWFMFGLCYLLTLGGIYEFHHALKVGGKDEKIPFNPMMITSMILATAWYVMCAFKPEWIMEGQAGFYFVLASMLIFMAECVFDYPKRSFMDAGFSLFSLVYVCILFSMIYLVRNGKGGQFYVWFIFAASWASDVFAYFTGMAFGKHRMTPKLSPKKTIEGALGGIIGAIIICVIFGMLMTGAAMVDPAVMLKFSLLTGLVGSLVSIVGDLFASSIKRTMNIKDFSKLIPGHGGVLDRFDSTLMVTPVVLVLLVAFKML